MGLLDDFGEATSSTNDVGRGGEVNKLGLGIFGTIYVLGMIFLGASLAIANLQMGDITGLVGGFIGLIIGISTVNIAYKITKFIIAIGIIGIAIYVIYIAIYVR